MRPRMVFGLTGRMPETILNTAGVGRLIIMTYDFVLFSHLLK